MPLLRTFCLMVLICCASGARGQEYIQQQTKAQCDARGGRITQWMSSIGVFPEVGTCFVPPLAARSDRDQPSQSCANFARAFKQFEDLKVPDQATAAQLCSHYGKMAQFLERAINFLPCDDYPSSYPGKLRQSMNHLRENEIKLCAKAKAEAEPSTAPPQNNLLGQMKSLFNFDEDPGSDPGRSDPETTNTSPTYDDPIMKTVKETMDKFLERMQKNYAANADKGLIQDFTGGEVPPPHAECPDHKSTFDWQPAIAICRYGVVGRVENTKGVNPDTVHPPITQWWRKYQAVVFAEACDAGPTAWSAINGARIEAAAIALNSAKQQVANLDDRFVFQNNKSDDQWKCKVLREKK